MLVAALVLAVAVPQLSHAAAPVDPHSDGRASLEGLHSFGPPLTRLRNKIADRNWVVAWLLKPARLRRHQRMRRLKITAEDAEAVTTFLYAGSPPTPTAAQWRGGDPRTGETLFITRGCRGCHSIGSTEASQLTRAPDLAGIGIKVRGDWLFNWLKSPRAYDPNTAMPQLALSDDDIRHLVAFLLSHREGADVVAAAARLNSGDLPDARVVIERFDCPKCHLVNGFETVAVPTRWSVEPQACASCHEPGGPSAAPDGDSADAALRTGGQLVAYYNCRGCHRIDGTGGVIAQYLERKTLAPPTLDGEGARVQTSWLVDFLRHPTTLRPWLQVRMPDYSLSQTEARALAQYFAALSHAAAADEPLASVPDGSAALGRRRFAHFKCVQCHPASDAAAPPSDVDPDDLSINLMLAKTRLRPSWIRDFLARPKAIVGTETRMPAVFYTSDGIPKVDHPEQDIAAISAYLSQMTEPPPATDEERGHPKTTPDIDWSHYQY